MNIRKISHALVAATAALVMATPAQAALQGRDLNSDSVIDAFYDTTLNITWLRNANVNGAMNWNSAVAWAAGYSFGGYSDWRLPTMVDTGRPGCVNSSGGTECGPNVQTTSGSTVYSEMASLWYDTLGNKAGRLTNTGDFLNLQSYVYWSGLEYAPDTRAAWYFAPSNGIQAFYNKNNQLYALAVRPGDVPGDVLAVPEPGTLALVGLALAGLGLVRRRALGASGL